MSLADDQKRREVGKFFDGHQGALAGFLLNMVLSQSAAEDILNECFLVIWKKWEKLRDGNPRAYLYIVARNLIKNLAHLRSRQAEDFVEDFAEYAPTENPVRTDDFAQQVVDRMAVRWALQTLT